MKQIILSKGEIALVDDEDFDRISRFKWFKSNNGYAVRTKRNPNREIQKIHMHRFILNISENLQVDHRNNNKLDNQKMNLRPATNSQNQSNRGKQKNNTSGFKGVSFTKRRSHLASPWQAKIHVNRRTIYLGVFKTPQAAAEAYDKAAKKYFGEFGWLNYQEGGVFI